LYRTEAALTAMTVSEMFANTTPEQMAAGMSAWNAWHQNSGCAVVDLGTPLDKSTSLSGGSATPEKTSITGYSMLQASSMEEALALMKDHPHFHMPGSSVQVLECIQIPGM
jgi:hypothetical protein